MSEHKTDADDPVGDSHTWLSNPLDWRFVDRLIALGVISTSVSVIFFIVISAAVVWQKNNP